MPQPRCPAGPGCAAQVAVPLLAGLALLASGQAATPGLVLLGMAALTAFVFWLWRNEIGLAGRLLGVSAHGLVANPHLVTTAILLSVIGMLAILPLLVLAGA